MIRWRSKGRIFNPVDWELPLGCTHFAQSPQVLEIETGFRVYFSTRTKDLTGKYLSHIAYVEYSKDWSEVIGISKHEVLKLGALGCYDEHGVFPLNVLQVSGNEVLGFIGGWNRRVSVSVDGCIGLSKSFDGGRTFTRVGPGPILGPTYNEPCLIGDPFVKRVGGEFHMWYIFGREWIPSTSDEPEARIYKISHATSTNGQNWMRSGKYIIESVLGKDECQALPTVFEYGGRFHMVFCYRHATGFRSQQVRGYRLGYAHSHNLIEWTRDDNLMAFESQLQEWDSNMQCYPHVYQQGENVYLLHNGNEFGKFGFGLSKLIT